jgi:hypothetical protein
MHATRKFLERLGLPGGDAYSLPDSPLRFKDGAHYRFEVPGIQGPGAMRALLEELERQETAIHRVTQTKGIMLLGDEEITSMVELSALHRVELVLAIAPILFGKKPFLSMFLFSWF